MLPVWSAVLLATGVAYHRSDKSQQCPESDSGSNPAADTVNPGASDTGAAEPASDIGAPDSDMVPDFHPGGINPIGEASGNDEAALMGDLPLLQDDETNHVWDSWAATWRVVFVLDPHNHVALQLQSDRARPGAPGQRPGPQAVLVEVAERE